MRLEVVRPLTLIRFDGPGLAILGATAEVVHSAPPYDVPQSWSKALMSHPVRADGIAYSSTSTEWAARADDVGRARENRLGGRTSAPSEILLRQAAKRIRHQT